MRVVFSEFKRQYLMEAGSLYSTTKPAVINFLAQTNLKQDALACLIVKKDAIIFIGTEGDCALEMNAAIRKEMYADYSIEQSLEPLHEIKRSIFAAIKGATKAYIDCATEPIWLENIVSKECAVEIADDVFGGERSIYDSCALENIKKCVALNEKVYVNLKERYVPGMTEYEVKALILKTYFEETGVQIALTGDIVSGCRTLDIAGDATRKAIVPGDTLILDLLPRYNGVCCDTTRTFFTAKPTRRQRSVYLALVEVLEGTKAFMKPGIEAEAVYAQMMRLLAKEDLARYMPHHAGHGLGYGMFQKPKFIQKETTVLQEGMVVALEPGVYLPGEFGIRIEDNYRIHKSGCDKLGAAPLDIDYFVLGG